MQHKPMNIKNLQLFIHLSDSLSFHQTAQAMHISPSALSRVIQRLEQELGQSLFRRDNRSVELTIAGKKLIPVATTIISNWLSLKIELNSNSSLLQGKLKIFCSVTASYSHLPSILTTFRHRYPQIEIQLLTGDSALAIDKVLNGEVDVAITAKPEHLSNKLTYIELDHIPMSVISPAISPPAIQQLLNDGPNWQALPFIVAESGPARSRANTWFKDKKITPPIYAQISGHEAIVSMVALGCGIGIAPDIVINNSPMSDKVQRFPAEFIAPLSLGLCCKQSRHQESVLKALLQLF